MQIFFFQFCLSHYSSVLSPILQWTSKEDNTSMVTAMALGKADLSGGVFLPSLDHNHFLDFVMLLWPYR